MIHFPKETKGCYYERLEDCCWLCIVRIVVSLVVLGVKLRAEDAVRFIFRRKRDE